MVTRGGRVEGRRTRKREKPIENTIKRHEIVRGIGHTKSRNSGPSEDGRRDKRKRSKEKSF